MAMFRIAAVLMVAGALCACGDSTTDDGGRDTGVADATGADTGDAGGSGDGTWTPPGCGDGERAADELCDPPGSCPTACEPSGACFEALLVGNADWCTAQCIDVPIIECTSGDGCCPRGCDGMDDDCPGLCGNGVLDEGETCDAVEDCPTSCDDVEACTIDTLVGAAATCNAACEHRLVIACADGDGCCAAGCTPETDDDCEATCGNGAIEPGETCDGTCPAACESLDACTVGVMRGSAETCDVACVMDTIDVCRSGDGCCPLGCTDATDDDCIGACEGGGDDLQIGVRSASISGDVGALWQAAERLSTIAERVGADGVRDARLVLRDPTTGDRVVLADAGVTAFDVRLAPGQYDAVIESGDGARAGFVVRRGVDVSGDGAALGDLDFAATSVRGAITINGAVPPTTPYDSGSISLRRTAGGNEVLAGTTTSGAIDAPVATGVYDVIWRLAGTHGTVPANPVYTLQTGVALAPGDRLDVDVPAIHLVGDITLNGAAFPNQGYDEGTISLRRAGSSDLITLARTSWGSYDIVIVPGVYDVIYQVEASSTTVPDNAFAVVRRGVSLSASGTFDIDVPSVRVRGELTLNGAPFSPILYDRAFLYVRPSDGGELTLVADTMGGGIDARLVPGRYDVVYRNQARGPEAPLNTEAVLATDVLIDGAAFDIDVPGVTVTGAILLDGAPFPASNIESGVLSLWDGEASATTTLAVTQQQSFSVVLIPGAYDVYYRVQHAQVEAPINTRARVAVAEPFLTSGPHDIDVRSVRLHGAITLGGAPFPGGYNLAALRLVDEAGAVSPLSSTAQTSYDVRVVPGTYYVSYDHQYGSDIPQNSGARVTEVVEVVADTLLDVNVASQGLGGGFTVDGLPFSSLSPDNQASYSVVDVDTGERIALGAGSARTFATRLITGRYELRYAWSGGDALPQNADARLGCVDIINPM